MTIARLSEMLVLSKPTKVGLLAEVTSALMGAGVNTLAILAYDTPDGRGEFMVVTEDNELALEALERTATMVRRVSVVLLTMPDELGALDEAARRISEADINIHSVFATAGDGTHVTVVLQTADDEAAAALFTPPGT